jgi:hypothetical protein
MHSGSHATVEIEALDHVGATKHSGVGAGDAEESSLPHCSYGCVEEGDHRSVGIQVHDIESSLRTFTEQNISVFEAPFVGEGIQLIEIEVVLHEFVSSWHDIIGDDFADSFKFFEVADSPESAG